MFPTALRSTARSMNASLQRQMYADARVFTVAVDQSLCSALLAIGLVELASCQRSRPTSYISILIIISSSSSSNRENNSEPGSLLVLDQATSVLLKARKKEGFGKMGFRFLGF